VLDQRVYWIFRLARRLLVGEGAHSYLRCLVVRDCVVGHRRLEATCRVDFFRLGNPCRTLVIACTLCCHHPSHSAFVVDRLEDRGSIESCWSWRSRFVGVRMGNYSYPMTEGMEQGSPNGRIPCLKHYP
jgi:hypothetical protein